MRIVVTGGAGDLGSRVVREATARGHDVVPASRRTGVDLTTGEGLEDALLGADAVVHCADDTSRGDTVTVYATRRLADAAASHGVHLVHISIVGIDEHPMTYYRRKLRAEQGIDAAGRPGNRPAIHAVPLPHSIFRPKAECRPVHRHDRRHGLPAGRHRLRGSSLVDVAAGPRPTAYVRAPDVAGPDVLPIGEVARLVRAHRGASPPRVVRVPPLGRLMRAIAESRNVPAAGTADLGGRTFADWLATQPGRLTGR